MIVYIGRVIGFVLSWCNRFIKRLTGIVNVGYSDDQAEQFNYVIDYSVA